MLGMPSASDPLPVSVRQEAADIAAFRERHGLPGLVDIHTHFMPKPVLDKVWRFFEALDGHSHGGAASWPITYRVDEVERIVTLRAFGVRRFTSMLYPHKPEMAEWLNAWSAEFAFRTADCAHTATFCAEASATAYVKEALDAGAEVFKVHVQVGGFDPADPILHPVWGTLAEAGVPIVIHAGSGPEPGNHTGPGPIRSILAAHPDLVLVIAHMGMPEYADFLEIAESNPHVHLDTTMAFTDFTEALMPLPVDLLPRLRDLGGRVVLGSDFPNIPYPYLHQLEAIERLDLSTEWIRAVCWDNGARLLGVSPR